MRLVIPARRKALGFGAAMLASLPDPVNFIPVAGAVGKGASIGKRALTAAKEGVISTAIADAIIMLETKRRGEDIDFGDFALDVMFGGVLGAGLGGMSAAAGDFMRARKLGALDVAQESSNTAVSNDIAGFDTNVDRFYDVFSGKSQNAVESSGLKNPFIGSESLDQDVMRTLFLDHGMDVNEAKSLTAKMFDGAESRRLDDESLHELAAVMRKSIGGDARVRMGLFMEDLLQQTTRNSSSPIDYTALAEKYKMGEVYDRVYQEILEREVSRLDANEVLLVMRPDDEEPLVLERGVSIQEVNDALPIVAGKRLKRVTDSSGRGMVKVIIKHGQLSSETNKVTRADMMRIPQIIREYEPIVDEKYGSNRTWVVELDNGKRLVIGEGDLENGGKRVVTVFAAKDETVLSLSPKRNLQNPDAEFSAHVSDTTKGAYNRNSSESVGLSKVADTKNIGILDEDVNYQDTVELLDYGTESELKRLMDEGKVDVEALEALAEHDQGITRLEETKKAAMGVVNCVMKSVGGV